VIRWRGGRERLLAVDGFAGVGDRRLGPTSTGQSIKYPDSLAPRLIQCRSRGVRILYGLGSTRVRCPSQSNTIAANRSSAIQHE